VWRLNRALAGGGPLMDVGIYALQATRYLSGEEPTWVSALTTQGAPPRFAQVEESVLWEAKFPSGAVSHCSSSYNVEGIGYFRVLAERGWFGLEPAFNYGGLRGIRSDGKAIEAASTTSLLSRWMTSPDASRKRLRRGCPAKKACVM